jgi:hypothetical protein
MVAKNDITGDSIQTKGVTYAYRNHYDDIFRKKDKDMQVRVQEDSSEVGRCGCGRSPTGVCCGWHGLTEDEFRQALAEYEDKQLKENK